MSIATLIDKLKNDPNCIVFPPSSIPAVQEGHVLPTDVREFYSLCGGAILFENSAYSLTIVAPEKVVVANSVILVGVSQEQLDSITSDISWFWYIIGEGDNGQYITIDFSSQRLGKCYDSFWEIHPDIPPIIATSFTNLLECLIESEGKEWYWKQPGFKFLGYAYSEYDEKTLNSDFKG